SRERGGRGTLSRRPVLPAERDSDEPALAPAAHRGYSPARRSLPQEARGRRTSEDHYAREPPVPDAARVAGKRARARKRDRARRAPCSLRGRACNGNAQRTADRPTATSQMSAVPADRERRGMARVLPPLRGTQ